MVAGWLALWTRGNVLRLQTLLHLRETAATKKSCTVFPAKEKTTTCNHLRLSGAGGEQAATGICTLHVRDVFHTPLMIAEVCSLWTSDTHTLTPVPFMLHFIVYIFLTRNTIITRCDGGAVIECRPRNTGGGCRPFIPLSVPLRVIVNYPSMHWWRPSQQQACSSTDQFINKDHQQLK